MYKVAIRPVLLYAYETRPTTKRNEDKIAIFERKILRRIIFGSKINNITQNIEEWHGPVMYGGYIVSWEKTTWQSKTKVD